MPISRLLDIEYPDNPYSLKSLRPFSKIITGATRNTAIITIPSRLGRLSVLTAAIQSMAQTYTINVSTRRLAFGERFMSYFIS